MTKKEQIEVDHSITVSQLNDFIDAIYKMDHGPGEVINFLVLLFEYFRDATSDETHFSPEAFQALATQTNELLNTHLKSVLTIAETRNDLVNMQTISKFVFQEFNIPIVQLDVNGYVKGMNESFKAAARQQNFGDISRDIDSALFDSESEQQNLVAKIRGLMEEGSSALSHYKKQHPYFLFRTGTENSSRYFAVFALPADTGALLTQAEEHYGLTDREKAVLKELLTAQTTKQISERLFISEDTVKSHRKSLFGKTGSSKQTELVQKVYQLHVPVMEHSLQIKHSSSRLDQQITLPDGRQLSYSDLGNPSGEPVLFFHGIVGSRLESPVLLHPSEIGTKRWITVDRPGFGFSSPMKQRTPKDFADDIDELRAPL